MRRQKRVDTKPELALRRALHKRGLRYRVDLKILPDSRRRSDIVFTRARIAVEVFGCFWHGCPEHGTRPKANNSWWAQKLDANLARDRDNAARLREAGWTPVVVWEHEDPDRAADRIYGLVHPGDPSQEGTKASRVPTSADAHTP